MVKEVEEESPDTCQIGASLYPHVGTPPSKNVSRKRDSSIISSVIEHVEVVACSRTHKASTALYLQRVARNRLYSAMYLYKCNQIGINFFLF